MNKAASPPVEVVAEIAAIAYPSLQQPTSLNCQIIQRHFQLRDRRADLRVLSDFLLYSF